MVHAMITNNNLCRTPLDVMRVDTADGSHRFSVCYATYGYMGDLLRTSETLRWSKWVHPSS